MNLEEITAKARILVRRPAADVFDAFSRAEIMSKFWFTRRDHQLEEGQTATWYVGTTPDAFAIDIRVKKIDRPNQIVIEWGENDSFTTVTWTFEEQSPSKTLLQIEETGFEGNDEDIVARALDSTGGFNQVVVAAKSLLERDTVVNIVTDHA